VDDASVVEPTPANLVAANLVAVTTYEEIETAYANGRGPLRTYDPTTKKFPPVTSGYVSAPPTTTFTAAQTGPNQVTVTWSGFSPTALSRDGTDTSGSGPWSTGPLTNEPTEGSFAFDYLVQGDTYLFTAAVASGAAPAVFCAVKAPPLPALGMNGAVAAAQLAQMQTLGVKYVRTQITWNYGDEWADNGLAFYNADGSFNEAIITYVADIKALAESYGITVLFLLDGFISSVEPPAGTANYTPGLPYTPAAYAAACAWLCSQVKGLHLEGVNEPDGYANWNGTVPLLASDYAIAMPLIYAQCKAADPTCVIHIAPVSGVNGGALTWRQALLAALANFAEYIDLDGFHFYTWPRNAPPSTLDGQIASFLSAAGVTKPAWITEGGILSLTTNSGDQYPEMTDALQATYLPALIQLAIGLVEVFMIYCLQDYGTGSSAGYWGLIDQGLPSGPDADANPKPSYAAIQALYA
jgi:hypothetical protein